MNIKKIIFQKYFWVFSYIFYSFIAIIFVGFIKDLYFQAEDYLDIYHYLFGDNH